MGTGFYYTKAIGIQCGYMSLSEWAYCWDDGDIIDPSTPNDKEVTT